MVKRREGPEKRHNVLGRRPKKVDNPGRKKRAGHRNGERVGMCTPAGDSASKGKKKLKKGMKKS